MSLSRHPTAKLSSTDRILPNPVQNQKATEQPTPKPVLKTNINSKAVPYEKLALVAELLK